MKVLFLFYVFFVFKAFSDSSTLSPNPGIMNDDMKEMLSKIDFYKDIYELPKEIVLWTLDGDTVTKKFSNITFSWSIISPHSLFLPAIDLLSQKDIYRLVKKYAHTLYEKKDGTQPSFHHTPIRYENTCMRSPLEKTLPYFSQHWLWSFKQSKASKGDFNFILTATAYTPLTCQDIESEKPLCERTIWISNDMIDKIVSKLSRIPNCGERLARQFKWKTPVGRTFNVLSIASHMRYLISECDEEQKRKARDECGCYDILPCLFKDEVSFCLNNEYTEKESINSALKVLFEESC